MQNVKFPSDAQRHDRHAEQAAKAAAERARKEAEEQRAKYPIGKTGDWKSLGLPPGRDLPAAPAEPKIAAAEALERLRRGETVTDPRGKSIRFGHKAGKHLGKKSRPTRELEERLQSLDRAEATVRDPLEIWRDPSNGREKYIRIVLDEKSGRMAVNVVTEDGEETLSWHSNSERFDYYRSGELLYLKP